jgi:hypothetical protein
MNMHVRTLLQGLALSLALTAAPAISQSPSGAAPQLPGATPSRPGTIPTPPPAINPNPGMPAQPSGAAGVTQPPGVVGGVPGNPLPQACTCPQASSSMRGSASTPDGQSGAAAGTVRRPNPTATPPVTGAANACVC